MLWLRVLPVLLLLMLSTGCNDKAANDKPINVDTVDNTAEPEPDPNHVILEESDVPTHKLHLLHKGDVVDYVLPNGRRLAWNTESDGVGSFEQATACGLKAYCREPAFEQQKDHSVSTSGAQKVSIYSFSIDGYTIERAEDLTATHFLPTIIRISKAGIGSQLAHEAARAFFAQHVPPATGQPPRVPISTVHDGIRETFGSSIRLVVIGNDIGFDIFGNLYRATEERRQERLVAMMNYVVDRYEGIEKTNRLSFEVFNGNETVFRYEARKSGHGNWTLHEK